MSTPSLLPTATEKAVADIFDLNSRAILSLKSKIKRIDRVMTQTIGDDGNKLTQEQIISAANGRLDNFPAFYAALKAAVNNAVPGTYTT
jgi:hypothetical protein